MTPRFRLRVAQAIVGAWIGLGLLCALVPQAPPLLLASSADLVALTTVLMVALLVGVPLGALAGSGPRWIDVTLGFTTDWTAALPAVLLLAFLRPAGVSSVGALTLLGVLRSLEVAWVVRSALLRAARLDPMWAARSLGHMPLSVFLTQRLPAAGGPALAHLALTPVWIFVLDAVGSAAGLGAASSEHSLGALVVRPSTSWAKVSVVVLALACLTWALLRLGRHYSLRLARK